MIRHLSLAEFMKSGGAVVALLVLLCWCEGTDGRRGSGNPRNRGADVENDLIFDYVVVGAGPGGSVLARRFADNGDSVAVIELGADSCSSCKSSLDVAENNLYDSRLKLFLPKPQSWTLGRSPTFLGYQGANGGSEIFGGVSTRPSKFLLDQLPSGFKYAELLPEMKELEDHYCHYFPNGLESADFPIPYPDISPEDCTTYHGRGGPIQISPQQPTILSSQVHALLASGLFGATSTVPFTPDVNGNPAQRFGVSFEQNFRVRDNLTDIGSARSKGKIFDLLLSKMYRQSHSNLRIFFHSRVVRFLFHKNDVTRVIGVEYVSLNSFATGVVSRRVFARKQVFLSAGVINTPQLLQLNGIGPASVITKKGIQKRALNEYVGKNLAVHQGWTMGFKTRNPVNHDYKNTALTVAQAFFYSDPVLAANGSAPDIQCEILEGVYTESYDVAIVGPPKGLVATAKERPPYSFLGFVISNNVPTPRGYVAIQSTDPFVSPEIDYGWDSSIDTSSDSLKLLKTMARLRSWVLGTLGPKSPLDTSSVIVKEVWPGDSWTHALENEFPAWSFIPAAFQSTLADTFHLKNVLHPIYHITGSCSMGEDSNEASCTDTHGRVRGVTGLSVCDNSIYPVPPDANPTAGMLAICSKIAKWHIANTAASQVGPEDLSEL